MRWAYGVLASALVVGAGGAEVARHDQMNVNQATLAIQSTWRQDVREGLPAAALEGVSHQLDALASRSLGPIPASWIPGALTDSLNAIRRRTDQLMVREEALALRTAEASLTALRRTEGSFAAGGGRRRREIAQSKTPAELMALTRRWDGERKTFAQDQAALLKAAGPEENGLPADVVDDVAHVQSLENQTQQFALSTDAADAALSEANALRNQPPGTQLERLQAVESALNQAAEALEAEIQSATPQTFGQLQPALEGYLSGREGNVAVDVYDALTGQTLSINGTSLFDTASIVKVSILGTLLDQSQTSDTALTPTQEALAVPMIEESNNDDATALWNAEGGAPAVASFVRAMGMDSTTPNVAWGLTQTTAPDQVKLVSALAYGSSVLTPVSRAYELSLMEHVTSWEAWGVTGGVPAGVTVALKNGWLPTGTGWVINSIGWVDGDGHNYVIAVLSNQNPSEQYGIDTADHVSSLVWDALSP